MISPIRFRLPVAIPRTKPVTAVDSLLHLLPGRRSVSSARSEMDAESYKFGPYKIDSSEVFRSTPLSYALVNLRPLVPVQLNYIYMFWYAQGVKSSASSISLLKKLVTYGSQQRTSVPSLSSTMKHLH
ncbi:bifunctional bis(5'-adenosyl)-triphosphatase/adenylylsulfatase FHIT [Iris pallida]|uniref:Bifunctional bis(5'-adenosyl)-triphosphatase/adenylylsulfatase FHIT n=1 Tax=Iris pallida TaxID=29817 RepID=A0AAX6HDZ4_IRIPA|nr:bifunctional bis(5'-adenosyl)-triphosphatase/adenylylsulfatase FHIT [Iris pallida]